MQTHTKLLLAILIGITTVWTNIHAEQGDVDTRIRQPDVAIYRFRKFDAKNSLTALRFTFAHTINGYTLTGRNGSMIAKDVYYVKTFGGLAPTIEIHLFDDRYIVYPETIKDSEVHEMPDNPMDAVTHIFDLVTGKVIWTSEKYRYDHDVPLRYDRLDIIRLAAKKKKAEQLMDVNRP